VAPPESHGTAHTRNDRCLHGHRDTLPIGWRVTSDSIAAAVAATVGAELILAKRVPPPGPASDLESLAAAGWVDEHFPTAARGLGGIGWAAPG
jgi:aspartokinase-like uncharacterized kinase